MTQRAEYLRAGCMAVQTEKNKLPIPIFPCMSFKMISSLFLAAIFRGLEI